MSKKIIFIVVLVVVAILLIFNFVGNSPDVSEVDIVDSDMPTYESGDDVVVATFEDKSWKWTRTVMGNNDVIVPKKSDAFTLTLSEDGSFNGTTDCNNYFGQYEVTGNKLTFGPIATTRMYCEGSEENIFTKALGEVDGFLFDEKGNLVLTIKFDSGSMMFE